MTPCHWCWAMVENNTALKHADWHRVHDLHASDCAVITRRLAQANTGAYLVPQECSCGLTTR